MPSTFRVDLTSSSIPKLSVTFFVRLNPPGVFPVSIRLFIESYSAASPENIYSAAISFRATTGIDFFSSLSPFIKL